VRVPFGARTQIEPANNQKKDNASLAANFHIGSETGFP
jgi:hypothetical protein